MLIKFQCVLPESLQIKDVQKAEQSTRVLKDQAKLEDGISSNFNLTDSKGYNNVKKIVNYFRIDEDTGEREIGEVAVIPVLMDYRMKDTSVEVDKMVGIVEIVIYAENNEEMYSFLDAVDYTIDVGVGILDIRGLAFIANDLSYPVALIDLDAPVGFQHPLAHQSLLRQTDLFANYSPREIILLALNLSATFLGKFIHRDYVALAQAEALNKSWISADDLAILKDEYRFIQESSNEYIWNS